MAKRKPIRVAVACQGGGSHTAFTAGVLEEILRRREEKAIAIDALSGSSGGAMCAFLAWVGLLTDDVPKSIHLLEQFWTRIAANSWWDALGNAALVMGQSQMVRVDCSPYLFPEWGRQTLENLLKELVNVEAIAGLIRKDSPELLVGAVDVRSGGFHTFRNQDVTVDALLASAAIPMLFRSAPVGQEFYWDGLYSQNPPVRDLARRKPDEIWIIQVNPPARGAIPQTQEAIRDRRNELAGNLSLEQELFFIRKINQFVDQGCFHNGEYKRITIKKAIMERDLPYASKLDRNPGFIRDMIAYGRSQAVQLF
jgi:NTE family protein